MLVFFLSAGVHAQFGIRPRCPICMVLFAEGRERNKKTEPAQETLSEMKLMKTYERRTDGREDGRTGGREDGRTDGREGYETVAPELGLLTDSLLFHFRMLLQQGCRALQGLDLSHMMF